MSAMKWMWPAVAVLLQDSQPKPWFGISMTLETSVPELQGQKFKHAIRVFNPIPDSPADKAGLRHGDLIVSVEGVDFSVDSKELIPGFRDAISKMKVGRRIEVEAMRDWVDKSGTLDGRPLTAAETADPEALLRASPPGPKFELTARRRQELLKLSVLLEAKPDIHAGKKVIPPADAIWKRPPPSAEELLARKLIEEHKIEADYEDLLGRLARLHEEADPWRLNRFAVAHRNPFSMPALAREIIGQANSRGLADLIRRASEWLDRPLPETPRPEIAAPGRTLEERIEEIVGVLRKAKVHWDKAFEKLGEEEMQFLLTQLDVLSETFTKTVTIDRDEKRERIGPNLRVLRLAAQVDYVELFRAAVVLSALVEGAPRMKEDLEKGLKGGIESRDSEFGKIVIAGPGRHWHREDAAVIIDLGGDDFYTNHAGGSAGRGRPFSIVIDYGGDDAYEATFDSAQGCGRLGVGILADLAGNDTYIGQRWAQGVASVGVGVLWDEAGDDDYRGWDYVQAAGLWGIGVLVDRAGNDTRTATRFAQSCAMAGGVSILRDESGDDRYFCKGRYPTAYGDAGLFDAWSQACAIGFRGLASGGLAVLSDLEGDDRYEAGHFSQGGGYYFGWGLMFDGHGSDSYMGSRYAQGFAAHQAMGYFEDAAGNDRYGTRQAVAQGLSWDETVVAFNEGGGDDVYDGGGGFSLGASAHNGFCLFVDRGGDDVYRSTVPARSGPNDYHGGTSFSLFVDEGGGRDQYEGKEARNDAILKSGAHGFFVDR
jgi:hypothetical protein